MKGTQNDRLLAWLRANPGASGAEIFHALNIPKYTSRISDLRKLGYDVVCVTDDKGVKRYRVREPRPVTVGEQTEAFAL